MKKQPLKREALLCCAFLCEFGARFISCEVAASIFACASLDVVANG